MIKSTFKVIGAKSGAAVGREVLNTGVIPFLSQWTLSFFGSQVTPPMMQEHVERSMRKFYSIDKALGGKLNFKSKMSGIVADVVT